MPSTPSATPTPITPPRVSLIDPRTGLIDRAWYMFFLSLFTTATNAENADTGPSATGLLASFDAELRLLADVVGVQYDAQSAIASLAAALAAVEQQTAVQPPAEIGELQQQIDALSQAVGVAPTPYRPLSMADIPTLPYNPTAAPATYTANFSVATTDVWIINNKSGSSCTATLPAASSYSGRVLYFQNYQAQTLVSASSNVVPVGGGAAATSILLASAGDQCTLVSNGTNWIMMQYVPNNSLLLE